MKLHWFAALGLAGAFALTFSACGSDELVGLSGTTGVPTGGTTTGDGGDGGNGTGGDGGNGTGGEGGNGTGGEGGNGTGGEGGNGTGGEGGNGTGGEGGNGTGGMGVGGMGAGGGPDCIGCGDVVQGGGNPADLCTMNGPPASDDLFNALFTCVCVDSCAAECGASICSGMDPSVACQNCIFGACGTEAQTCIDDTGVGPPPPPPPCTTCGDALPQNGGDPADLCTMNGPPSSAALYDTFFQCACVDSCPAECAGACMGGLPDGTCTGCINGSCLDEATNCLNDTGGPPPPPPPCESCNDALMAGGATNLCSTGSPSSEDLYVDLFLCACTACVAECTAVCNNVGPISGPCQNCGFNNCMPEVNACLADN